MNELRAEVKKLMSLARGPLERRSETAPFGFAARVVAKSQLMVKPPIRLVQRAFSIASWAAASVIVSCSVLLLQQHRAADAVSQIMAAAQHFAETISP
jgi:hypothetical protein